MVVISVLMTKYRIIMTHYAYKKKKKTNKKKLAIEAVNGSYS